MRRSAAALFGVVVACSALTQCGGSSHARRVSVTGSSTIAPVVLRAVPLLEAQRPGLRVDVQSGGSSRGLADLRAGLADVAMVSRALAPLDGPDLEPHVLALDAVVLVVHESNPLQGLTSEQVRDLWRGRIRDGAAIGAAPGPVTVVQKASGRGTFAVFMEHFGLAEEEVRPDVIAGENEQVVRTVASDPRAIGYVSLGAVLHDRARGVAVRPIALDGVAPTLDAVRSGRWPLVRPLLLVTHRNPAEPARLVVDFLLGDEEVRRLLAEEGFVAPRS